MATARLITAEIYDFAPPPNTLSASSTGVVYRYGVSVILRSVVSMSVGQRDTAGISIQMGVTTVVAAEDLLITAIDGVSLTTGLL